MSRRSFSARLQASLAGHLDRQVLLLFGSVLTVASVLLLALILSLYRAQLVDMHARASLEINQLLQAALENAMLKRDINGLREIVTRLGEQPGVIDVMILNPAREVRFASRPSMLGIRLERQEVVDALQTRQPQTVYIAINDETEGLRSVNPVANKAVCGDCHGGLDEHPLNGLLIIDYDAAGVSREAWLSASILGASGVSVIFGGGLALWLVLRRRVLARIDKLQQAAQRLAEGELDTRVDIGGSDEIATCALTFNRMASELEGTVSRVAAAERLLQSIIDAVPDGIRVIDSDFRILKVNKAYLEQLGQSRDDVLRRHCHASSHQRAEPCPETLVNCPVAALRRGDQVSLKLTDTHFRDDGSALHVEVSVATVQLPSLQGPIPVVVESIRNLSQAADISHRQRLSEIGLLATGVAHEIHNPLSSIELALAAIRQSMDTVELDGGVERYFDIVEREIRKCIGVTESLLHLSEPPAANELVMLEQLVPDVLALLSFQFGAKGIDVKIEFGESLRVLASESDIRMLVMNLALNALHAMPDGGHLDITGHRRGNDVHLEFTDTGIGIQHEHYDKIFLPFWTRRADASSGKGLGLYICRSIVERSGGRIAVYPNPEGGSCFVVTLPCADGRDHRQA